MNQSILVSIKKLLGISEDYNHFDTDLIMHINSVFMVLNQLGVGPADGFRINDETEEWNYYLDDEYSLEAVKTYIYMKVKLIFDPPLSSAAMESLKQTISELEWRLNVQAESQ